jgi:hypothetical protein
MTLTEAHYLIEDHVEAAVIARLGTESISVANWQSATEVGMSYVSLQYDPGGVDESQLEMTSDNVLKRAHVYYPQGMLSVVIQREVGDTSGRATLAKIRRILALDKRADLNNALAAISPTIEIGDLVEQGTTFEIDQQNSVYTYSIRYSLPVTLRNAVEVTPPEDPENPLPTDATQFTYADKAFLDYLKTLYPMP